MIIVSNTSPIINLAAIGRLELLQHLYNTITIPEAVYHEIAVRGHEQPGAIEIQTWDWFKRYQVQDVALVRRLQQQLDAGEAESIALAVELQADLLLMDEHRGRMTAQQSGLRVIGLLGVLLIAKHRGHLPAIKPALQDLTTRAGFWVDQQLYMRVLQSAGELED